MSEEPQDLVQTLREQSRRGLQFLINYLLSNAEQTLLASAGKSRGNLEQTQNQEAIRELRMRGTALERSFMARAMEGFERLGQPAPPPATRAPQPRLSPAPADMQIDGLGVVKDTILEEQLALENVAGRARHEHRDALLRLAHHVARASGNRRVDIETFPIGPQALAVAFMEACRDIEIATPARAVFFRLFTRFIIDELGPFYAQCLALLPEEDLEYARGSGPARAADTAAPELPTGRIEDDDVAAQGGSVAPAESIWDSTRTPLLAPPGKAMAMPRNLVDEVLESLQESMLDARKPLAALNPKAGIQPLDLVQLLNDTLAETGYTRPMALPADVVEAIGLVRLLFEHALRDAEVPAPVRRIQRLLQIPLLRAALREPEVLSGKGHPARELFSEIGTSAAGWSAPADGSDDDFLRLLKLLVTRVLNDYEKDAAVFRGCVDDLRRYLRARDGAGRAEAQAAGIGEVNRADAQAARAAVAAVVSETASGVALPHAGLEFLRGPWSDALLVIRLRDGEASAEWGLAVETTRRLVAATRTDAPAGDLELVAQGIRRGLQRLGMDAESAARKVQALATAIAGGDPASERAQPAAPKAPTRPPASPEFVQLVDRLAVDGWVELREPGSVRRRVKLLLRNPRTSMLSFVDAAGDKAAEIARGDLASMIEQGEARILHGVAADGSTPPRPGRR